MSAKTSTEIENLLANICKAGKQLDPLITADRLFENWDRISELRSIMADGLSILLVTDLKFCQAKNVEQTVWKINFYNLIELLRICSAKDTSQFSHKCKLLLLEILEESSVYFTNLIKTLEKKYKFDIEFYFSNSDYSLPGFAGLALISAQKILIFLGDLARYKELVNKSSNFFLANQYYDKARQINPKNGKPFNQLALLAVYKRNILDAVYFYMRSIMASNTFSSAKESLKSIFHENEKKYNEKTRLYDLNPDIIDDGLRREIWIHPIPNLKKLKNTIPRTPTETSKEFLSGFLYVHGKFFSKIGLENLEKSAFLMINDFKDLLNCSLSLPLSMKKFLEILSINAFSIDTLNTNDEECPPDKYFKLALNVAFQMFGLIIEKLIRILENKQLLTDLDSDIIITDSDINTLLTGVMIWCNWLRCNQHFWNLFNTGINSVFNFCWNKFAVLISILDTLNYEKLIERKLKKQILIFSSSESDQNLSIIKLPEDLFFAGFKSFSSSNWSKVYSNLEENYEQDLAKICLRIHRIIYVAKLFCDSNPPILKLNPQFLNFGNRLSRNKYVYMKPDMELRKNLEEIMKNMSLDDDDEIEKNLKAKLSPKFENLLLNELAVKCDNKETQKSRVKEIFTESKNRIEIEIRPKFLIPDTNCFIDYFDQLLSIVSIGSEIGSNLYYLVVPLVVFCELNSLAKDAEKNSEVQNKSIEALKFIDDPMNGNVKFVTTFGSLLTSTSFSNENYDGILEIGKNDDKILESCKNLSNSRLTETYTADNWHKIKTDVIFLTGDKNLIIKALSYNVPVKSVSEFLIWTGI